MPDLTAIIEQIHKSPVQMVLVVTGGGSRAVSELLCVPGASRTVVEARIPYAAATLTEFLGSAPEHFCSPETARAMAVTAYLRSAHLVVGATADLPSSAATDAPPLTKGGPGAGSRGRDTGTHVAGIACTASLISDRPKKGPHRCHVAVQNAASTTTYSLELTKGLRDRQGEEEVVARVILTATARACGISEEVPLGLSGSERVQSRRSEAPPPIAELFAGAIPAVLVKRDGSIEPISHRTSDTSGTGVSPVQLAAVLPGAFNPLHEGHRALVQVGGEILGTTVYYEISLFNVDKPALNFTDVEDRLNQFRGESDVVLTRAATFLEKARVLPGCTFVVGYDTAVRIVAPRYYGGEDAMLSALAEMRALGTRFLVAGRLEDSRYCTLADITIPEGYADLFQPIPEDRFRRDISSTALRAAENGDEQ